jgi:hypothetical protein
MQDQFCQEINYEDIIDRKENRRKFVANRGGERYTPDDWYSKSSCGEI